MKLLFDQNLSYRLVGLLANQFPNSMHVRDVGLANAADSIVWEFAAKNAFVIASKDTDFQQRALLLGHPPKVVWVRVGNCSTAAIVSLFSAHVGDIKAFTDDPAASFLVLS